jgi:hypothetical protein
VCCYKLELVDALDPPVAEDPVPGARSEVDSRHGATQASVEGHGTSPEDDGASGTNSHATGA